MQCEQSKQEVLELFPTNVCLSELGKRKGSCQPFCFQRSHLQIPIPSVPILRLVSTFTSRTPQVLLKLLFLCYFGRNYLICWLFNIWWVYFLQTSSSPELSPAGFQGHRSSAPLVLTAKHYGDLSSQYQRSLVWVLIFSFFQTCDVITICGYSHWGFGSQPNLCISSFPCGPLSITSCEKHVLSVFR